MELKGKFKGAKQSDFFVESSHITRAENISVATDSPVDEAVAALIALGYKPADAEKMVKKVVQPDLTSERLIREALKAAL